MVNGNTLVGKSPELQAPASAQRRSSRMGGQSAAFSFADLLPDNAAQKQPVGGAVQPATGVRGPGAGLPLAVSRGGPGMGQQTPLPAQLAVAGPEHVARMQNAVQETLNRRQMQMGTQAPAQAGATGERTKTTRLQTISAAKYGFGMQDTRKKAQDKNILPVLNGYAQPAQQDGAVLGGKRAEGPASEAVGATALSETAQAMLAYSRKQGKRAVRFTMEASPAQAAQSNAPAGQRLRGSSFAGAPERSRQDAARTESAALETSAFSQPALITGKGAGIAAETAGMGGIAYGAVPNTNAYKRGGDNPAEMAVRTARHKKMTSAEQRAHAGARSAVSTAATPGAVVGGQRTGAQQAAGNSGQALGTLAARFESGEEGIAAIGYDAHGGTSYGKYQISSRAGTMKRFIQYLQETAPDIANRLTQAGSANTGGRSGKMPAVWRQIAQEEPQRFDALQNDFIRASHFEPAMEGIAKESGVSFERLPEALKEVLFSTAVQHGPAGAVRIVNRALNRVKNKGLERVVSTPMQQAYEAGKELIKNIYAIRGGQFGSSSAQVQHSVKNRLNDEMHEALAMFGAGFKRV